MLRTFQMPLLIVVLLLLLLLLLTNALGHASECFCFKLEACLLNCKSLYSVYHHEEVLGVDVVPMSLMCSFKCNF